IDGKLRYRNTGTDFQLIHPADDKVSYLVISAEKGKDATPRVVYPNGDLTLRKTDVQVVGIYQVIPVAAVRFPRSSPISLPDILKCRPSYCPLPPDPGPPPGPGPIPIQYSYQFMRDSSVLSKPVR